MRRDTFLLIGFVAFGAGCGGGGNSSPGGEVGGTEKNYGIVSASAVGAVAPPTIMGSGPAVFTGVYGAGFTKVAINLPPIEAVSAEDALANTVIVMNYWGRPYVYDVFTGELTGIGPEVKFSDDSTPNIAATGYRLVASQTGPNNKLSVYTMNLDGTGKKLVATPADNDHYHQASISPDGKTIVFRSVFTQKLFTVPSTGGTPTQLTPEGVNAWFPAWSSDGTKVSFAHQADSQYLCSTINKNGTGMAPTFATGFGQSSWFPKSNQFLYTAQVDAGYIVSRVSPGSFSVPILNSTDLLRNASIAPTTDRYVYQRGGANPGIYIRHIATGSETKIAEGTNLTSPSWGPYMRSRTLVGTAATFGSSIGGFIFGQVNQRVTSFVGIDAATRSTIKVEPQGETDPAQSVTVCVVSADSIKNLRYLNNLNGGVVNVVSPGSPVSGAVIAFDAEKGRVRTVATYSGNIAVQSGSKSYAGRFLGIWNDKGENIAPGGATRLSVDSITGQARH